VPKSVISGAFSHTIMGAAGGMTKISILNELGITVRLADFSDSGRPTWPGCT